MNLIAQLLERSKARANIETDYRLAKVLSINQSALGNYRAGRSLPTDKILAALCALSGDDEAVIAAQVQAERAQSDEGRGLWLRIAARLSSGASTAILSVLFTIGLIAAPADRASAGEVPAYKTAWVNCLYIVSNAVFVSGVYLHDKRHRWAKGLPGFSALRGAALLLY